VPDLARSRRVLGYNRVGAQLYVHLAPGGDATIRLTDRPAARPYLESATTAVSAARPIAKGLALSVDGRGRHRIIVSGFPPRAPAVMRLAPAAGGAPREESIMTEDDGRIEVSTHLAGRGELSFTLR
jgi:hypothetical protein